MSRPRAAKDGNLSFASALHVLIIDMCLVGDSIDHMEFICRSVVNCGCGLVPQSRAVGAPITACVFY